MLFDKTNWSEISNILYQQWSFVKHRPTDISTFSTEDVKVLREYQRSLCSHTYDEGVMNVTISSSSCNVVKQTTRANVYSSNGPWFVPEVPGCCWANMAMKYEYNLELRVRLLWVYSVLWERHVIRLLFIWRRGGRTFLLVFCDDYAPKPLSDGFSGYRTTFSQASTSQAHKTLPIRCHG